MSDLKYALLWAITGVVIGLFAFAFNYTLAPVSLPGYEIFAGPAMLALSFFSEETNFWHKMLIFILGQYVVYFLFIFAVKKLIRFYSND
jgi:hypothetical protein